MKKKPVYVNGTKNKRDPEKFCVKRIKYFLSDED